MILLLSGATKTAKKFQGHPNLGALITPRSANDVHQYSDSGIPWALDNGAFGDFDPEAYMEMLKKWEGLPGCLFVTSPDVVGDALTTRVMFEHWEKIIRRHNYPVAYVAQDGIQFTTVPWDRFEALFIGGSTAFKIGPLAAELIREAKERGKWVHMGRVNTAQRIIYAGSVGVDSFDGTGFSMFPNEKLGQGLKHAGIKQSRMEDIA